MIDLPASGFDTPETARNEAARKTGIVPVPRAAEFLGGHCDLSGGFSIRADRGLENEAALARLWLGLILPAVATADASGDAAMAAGADAAVEAANAADAAVEVAGTGAAGNGGATACGAVSVRLMLVDSGASDSGCLQDTAGKGYSHTVDAESFRLEILPEEIRITGTSRAGTFYGIVSLRQLAMSHGSMIPAMRIDDSPRFGYRGFMLDTVRNFFRVEFIEKMLELAAFHKLNIFHWHLTDDQAWRLEIPARPEIARAGSTRLDRRFNVPQEKSGSYSPADVSRIVEFAAARHITVVPEIETPGHALALLASHPELSCRGSSFSGGAGFSPEDRYGVFDDILCAGNDEVFSLLGDVYDYLALMFPGPLVHAGGDEAPKHRWKSCPSCLRRMAEVNLVDRTGAPDPEKLQAWFMGRIAGMLSARGKRMIGWDEVLEGGVREDTVIMSWRGYSGGLSGARAGYDVVMSPQTKACYLDHKHLDLPEEPGQLGTCTVRDSYLFDPLPPGLAQADSRHILGAQANIWSELMYFGRQVEYMAFPRLCALSEAFWSPVKNRDFADFIRRMREFHEKRLDDLDVNRFRGANY